MNGTIFKKELLIASYAAFWDKVCYYGIQSILILFLIKHFHLSDDMGYAIYGGYTTLSFGFSIVGGIVADKLLGIYRVTLFACALISAGAMMLMFSHIQCIYLGLALMIVGFGLLKPCTPSLVGLLHKEDSEDRSKAFSLFYFFLNVGSVSGPLLFGFFYNLGCYWAAYLFGALGFASVFYFVRSCKNLLHHQIMPITYLKCIYVAFILSGSILISYFLLMQKDLFLWFFLIATTIAAYFLYSMLKEASHDEKVSLLKLLLPIVSSIICFAILLQIFSSITLFVDRYVDKQFLGFDIPTAWFSSIEAVMLIVLTPFLNQCWDWFAKKELTIKPFYKTMIGLFFSGIAFLSFSCVASLGVGYKISTLFFLIAGYSLLAISELSVIPTTISLTNLLSPQRCKGTIMGFFYFVLMSSGYLATVIAKKAPPITALQVEYCHFFLLIALMLVMAAGVLLSLNALISKKMILTKTTNNLVTYANSN